jgi:hypothetical protein
MGSLIAASLLVTSEIRESLDLRGEQIETCLQPSTRRTHSIVEKGILTLTPVNFRLNLFRQHLQEIEKRRGADLAANCGT